MTIQTQSLFSILIITVLSVGACHNKSDDWALKAIEVIIQTGIFRNKQGSGHTLQIQRACKLFLEISFDVGNGPLGIIGIQIGLVTFRNIDFIHKAFHHSRKYTSYCILFFLKIKRISDFWENVTAIAAISGEKYLIFQKYNCPATGDRTIIRA